MKNFTKIFMAVMLLAGAVACVQDHTEDAGGFEPTTSIAISLDDANKTYLGEKTDEGIYPLYWSKNDQVSVNGVASAKLEDVEENATVGLFEFTSRLETPYKASYPATEAGKVFFATHQTYKAGSVGTNATTMYGESNELTLAMKHLSGVLKFPIKLAEGDALSLSHAVVTNPNGKLAGLYNIELVDGEPVFSPCESAVKSVFYYCNDLKLSTTPVDLYIAVPSGEYEELKVTLVATDGRIMNFKVKAAGENAIKAGYVREFEVEEHIIFSGNEDEFVISDNESLMEFAQLCAEGSFTYRKAVLTNSIEWDSATYGPWKTIPHYDFGGEFDGGGHTISGLTDTFFGSASGNIHDINIVANAEVACDSYDGIGLLAHLFEGTLSNVNVKGSLKVTGSGDDGYNGFGGVIGEIVGSTDFVNVVNEASVTVDGVNNTRNGVAGILGGTNGSGQLGKNTHLTFTNCHNKADITSLENGGHKRRNMGGIVGYSDGSHELTITNCSNSGNITNNTVIEDLHMGGLVGTNMCAATNIINSFNTGNVICGGAQTETGNNYSLGGIIGYQTSPLYITNCVNGATMGEGGIVTKDDECIIKIGTAPGGTSLGGIVGYIHGTGNPYVYTIENCSNYGTVINTKDSGRGTNGFEARAGGIIAYINTVGEATIRGCHNHGTIERDAEETNWDAKGDSAGIICRVAANTEGQVLITECVNEADAKIVFRGKKKTEVNMGGIMACSGSFTTLSNCQNYGEVLSYGTMNSAMSLAGIIGNVSSEETVVDGCTNYAAVKQLSGRADRLLVGGICGYSYSSGTIQNCINEENGLIEISNSTDANGATITNASAYIAVGGIVGYARGTIADLGLITGCTNKANLVFSGYSSTNNHFGGCIGVTEMNVDNLTNEGDLTFGGISTSNYCAGGVIGSLKDDVTKLYNNGNLTFGGESKAEYRAGGVVGFIDINSSDDKGPASLKTAENTGAVTFGGTAATAYYAGGVVGYTNYPVESLTNGGTLTFGGTATTAYYAGGVVGNATAELTSLTNSGAVTYTGTATDAYYIGGVAGHLEGANATTLKNSGEVTLKGYLRTGKTNSANVIDVAAPSVGGVVGYLGVSGDEVYTANDLTNTASVNVLPTSNSSHKSNSYTFGGVIGLCNNYKVTKAYFKKNDSGVAPKINYTGHRLAENNTTNALNATAGVIGAAFATKAGADIDDCHNEGIINLNSASAQSKHNLTFAGIAAYVRIYGYGDIKNCSNSGSWIAGAKHEAGNKSMNYGGIGGSVEANVYNCTNSGSVIYETKISNTSTTGGNGNCFYSDCMGGIVGNHSNGIVSLCENTGSIEAKTNTMSRREGGGYCCFGGIIGNVGTENANAIEECTDNGSITVAEDSEAYAGRMWVGGLMGRISHTKTSKPYYIKDCTVSSSINAPAIAQAGIATGSLYATAETKYTPTNAATDFPVIGCTIKGGSIVKLGASVPAITAENFHNYIYGDVPAVATWTATETLYHGNTFNAQ